jgi:hypothetical protein
MNTNMFISSFILFFNFNFLIHRLKLSMNEGMVYLIVILDFNSNGYKLFTDIYKIKSL